MGSFIWWGKVILVALGSLFFLLFGIESLIGSFHLKNPLEFIMYFFSSSLMVLVSVVGLVYAISQIHAFFNLRKMSHDSK